MTSRWYNVAVSVFWLGAMSWLVVAKVLPPLLVGEPPSYRTILATVEVDQPQTVGWEIFWNERRIGGATTTTQRRRNDMTEIENLVRFTELPLAEMNPMGFGALASVFGGEFGGLELGARNVVQIDPLGRLVGFRSSVDLGELKDCMTMQGTVAGNQLNIHVRTGDFRFDDTLPLSEHALVGDALSPQSTLPELRVGQTWTVPVYSPFHPPTSPVEILMATVERTEPIDWRGEIVHAHLVVYRSDDGESRAISKWERGKMWVAPDGRVLRQDVVVLGGAVRFIRTGAKDPIPVEVVNWSDARPG